MSAYKSLDFMVYGRISMFMFSMVASFLAFEQPQDWCL